MSVVTYLAGDGGPGQNLTHEHNISVRVIRLCCDTTKCPP